MHLQFAWSAWWEVHTDRPMGMGVGPVPFTALDAYAARFGVTGTDDFEAFRFLIRSLDGVYLKWVAERSKTKPQSGR
ncbi:hypothetical protein [Devosia sp. 63-57]|uniref:phage tail assembly chaperone n=1 Tax=Devosia sp. 63-57 TaxID=1895751 RepID=UPI00086F2545|nr:hypothetical protein [Devosia sp. 63-57]ODT50260.1 MAG: hypothetical protein ABS74_04910 [Pelagibacterium sp. SCN 63-126]ODU83015.1 MAG: hypothetical protein ABT14_16155 [Pelagibacterium sp. SCN 63-17]OJX45004.1 MAG: hypothetical protein BGO80_03910 [Devosia sp. 63-57]